MKRSLGLSFVVLLSLTSTSASAEPTKTASALPCEQTARDTYELNSCAVASARAADRHLNMAYRDLLRYLDPVETRSLVLAQRKWVAFRDADCGFWGAGDFQLAASNKEYCIADVSERRAKELDAWPPNSDRRGVRPHGSKR